MTTLCYEDLVAAATIGLAHSQVQVTGLSGPAAPHAGVLDKDDPAAALLDAAALLTAARRAGVLPGTGPSGTGPSGTAPSGTGPSGTGPSGTGPPAAGTGPAPADTEPELPARAADLLVRAHGSDPFLLADLLALAATRGYRAPAPMLPALLGAAVRDPVLRPSVAAALGARGRWLARHRSGWRRVAGLEDPGPPPQTAAGDAGAWETGNREQRRGYLMAVRDRDPAAARELLAAGWSRQTGDERTDLIAVLARGLSPADETFLERALDDRKESVRAAARQLLLRLPHSAFSRRAAGRAVPLLRLDQRGEQRWLIARPPGAADAAAVRDGIVAQPARHNLVGPWLPSQAMPWLLTQMIAAAPLTVWASEFGLSARQIVALPFPAGLRAEVHAGWRIAAVRQASPPWAEALLEAGQPRLPGDRPPTAGPDDSELAALLPPQARIARVAAMLSDATAAPGAVAEIAGFPRPWSGPLADAVIALLRHTVATSAGRGTTASMFERPEQLASLAGRGLPVTGRTDYAAALAQLASAEHCLPSWVAALHRAADTIALRRAFTEEIR
jgi:Family of unknown function (DUF5691)